jgi:hypothetical protein
VAGLCIREKKKTKKKNSKPFSKTMLVHGSSKKRNKGPSALGSWNTKYKLEKSKLAKNSRIFHVIG